MAAPHLEPLLKKAERCAVLAVLRAHPEWTLAHVCAYLDEHGPHAAVLGELTIGELVAEPSTFVARLPPDGGPPIVRARLGAARRLTGERFDASVREVLAEAGGRPVAAAYLRARVGGPRWKLLASLGRLVAAGEVVRSGTTSGTRYRIAQLPEETDA